MKKQFTGLIIHYIHNFWFSQPAFLYESLKTSYASKYLIIRIHKFLQNSDKEFLLILIKVHAGIKENEGADVLAKETREKNRYICTYFFFHSHLNFFKEK